MRMRYFRFAAGVERNCGIVVVIGEWPPRVMDHRGWTQARQIHERAATEQERDEYQGATRHRFFRYDNVGSLIADERQALADAPRDFAALEAALALALRAPAPTQEMAVP